jgi:hypothetical protein
MKRKLLCMLRTGAAIEQHDLPNPFCYDAAMNRLVMSALLIGAICAPLAAQASEPKQVTEPAQTPDSIEDYEKGKIPVPSKLPPPSQIPEYLNPQEKALLQSAYKGDLQAVKAEVAKGAPVNLADAKKRTPVILAAYGGHTAVVEYLIGEGADVNAADSSGQTALIYTSKRSFTGTAALLLKNGADPNVQTRKTGTTALMIAAVLGDMEMLRLLLDNGADANLRDYFGDTARMLAEKKGNSAVVDLLSDPPGTADGK